MEVCISSLCDELLGYNRPRLCRQFDTSRIYFCKTMAVLVRLKGDQLLLNHSSVTGSEGQALQEHNQEITKSSVLDLEGFILTQKIAARIQPSTNNNQRFASHTGVKIKSCFLRLFGNRALIRGMSSN